MPSSDASLPFFSLFLLFSKGSIGEVREVRGVTSRGWIATSGVDPPACDSSSSSRLVFLCCGTIASGTSTVSWLLLTWAEGSSLGLRFGDLARFG